MCEIDDNKWACYQNMLFIECCRAYEKLLQHTVINTVLEYMTRTVLYSYSLP